MRVLITGGTGDIGTATSQRLMANGWDVHLIDQKEAALFPGVSYAQCDIMDFEALKMQMQGCDAVIHLAAIRAPLMAPNQDVFMVNVAGTFNVYEAAAQLGIKRVVQASSINAMGCAWQIDEVYPQYFPLDEVHPRFTTDSYSLSKQMAEDVADYFYHRDGISGTSLRFPWVYNREKHIGEAYFKRRENTKQALDDLLAQHPEAQQARLAKLHQEVIAFRKTRPLEYVQAQNKPPFAQEHADPLWNFYAFDRFNFWVILDDRDAAQALEKSLTSPYTGSHALFVNYPKNTVGIATKTLVDTFYPAVKWKKELKSDEALVSNDKAQQLIKFEPQYSLER
jgi:nucleoside-diphosphate-sugar epimerase